MKLNGYVLIVKYESGEEILIQDSFEFGSLLPNYEMLNNTRINVYDKNNHYLGSVFPDETMDEESLFCCIDDIISAFDN